MEVACPSGLTLRADGPARDMRDVISKERAMKRR
jgi:hypothetical protein